MVTQTTAALGLRPVANALGMSVVAMATLGLGMSARAQSRSTTPCSSGACSGVTSLACMAYMAILALNQYWQNSSANAMTSTIRTTGRAAMRMPMTRPVEHDEEEPRHEHAVGQSPVRLDIA